MLLSLGIAIGLCLGFSMRSRYDKGKISKLEAAKKELYLELASMKGRFEQLEEEKS